MGEDEGDGKGERDRNPGMKGIGGGRRREVRG